MSEPDDFDPIAGSLRRQFSPPPLDDLHARIAEAAAQHDAAAPTKLPTPTPAPARPGWRRPLGIALAFAAAAALLVFFAPWGDPSNEEPRGDRPGNPPMVAVAQTPQQLAGAQLDGFLGRGERLPNDGVSCNVAVATPPPNCEGLQPTLMASPDVQLVGECGGTTEVDCAAHDLPAQRAMLVRLEPSGALAIVCIEPPWADPHPELPPGSDYNIFRSTLGSYVLYEVTPLEQPQATPWLRL